jgi:hypothetical protein
MGVPTAKEMAEALKQTGTSLFNKKLIDSPRVFHELASSLTSLGKENVRWAYEISESNPIEFRWTHSPHINKNIRPRIYASIGVQQHSAGGVCFDRLDLALEIIDEGSNVLIKHHIDLANSLAGQFQAGPLFHIQFGGHTPKNTKIFEVPIKEPRWLCIPLDVVLLCEVVVANFYPEDWAELKRLPSWHDPIIASQKLCIIPFLNALKNKAYSGPGF